MKPHEGKFATSKLCRVLSLFPSKQNVSQYISSDSFASSVFICKSHTSHSLFFFSVRRGLMNSNHWWLCDQSHSVVVLQGRDSAPEPQAQISGKTLRHSCDPKWTSRSCSTVCSSPDANVRKSLRRRCNLGSRLTRSRSHTGLFLFWLKPVGLGPMASRFACIYRRVTRGAEPLWASGKFCSFQLKSPQLLNET